MKRIDFNDLVDLESFQNFLSVLDLMKKGMSDVIALSQKTASSGVPNNSKELRDYAASMQAALEAEKALKDIEEKRTTTLEKIKQYQTGAKDEQIKNTIALREARAAQEAKIKSDLSEIGSLTQMRSSFKLMVAEQDKLKSGSARFKELGVAISDTKTKINEAEQAQKIYTGQVGNYEIAVKSVRGELRETREALARLIESGAGVDNPQVKKLATRFEELKITMDKAKDTAELMNNAGMMAGFVKSIGAVSAAFEIAKGAAALFGTKNEELEKAMLKVQGAIALTHGLEVIAQDLKKGSIVMTFMEVAANKAKTISLQLYNLVVGESIGAMKAFRIALAATGIGLAIIAIALLVENWDKLKLATGGATEAQKINNDIQKKASESYGKDIANLEILKSKILNVNSSAKVRNEAIKDYNLIADKSNQIDATMLNNTAKIEAAITAQEKLIVKRATAKAIESKIEETITNELTRQIQVQQEGFQSQTKWYQDLWNIMKSGGNMAALSVASVTTGIKNDAAARGEAAATIKLLTDELLKFDITEKKETDTKEKSTKATKDHTEKLHYERLEIEQTLDDDKKLVLTEKELLAIEEARAKAAGLYFDNTIKLDAVSKKPEKGFENLQNAVDNPFAQLQKNVTASEEAVKNAIAMGDQLAEANALSMLKYNQKVLKAAQDAYNELMNPYKKDAANMAASLNALDDYAKEVEAKRQRMFDNEIDSSKRHQDLLKDMAARGNQDAKNNLAMEEANEAKIQLKKEKALQHQKQVEAGMAILKTYSAALGKEGATPESAIKDTLKSEVLLAALIKSLPAFFEGTEDTGEAGNLDSKGGKFAVIHPKERIMTAEQNKLTDGLTNWQLANAGLLYKKEIQDKESERFMSNEKVLQKFDELKQVIESKPVYMGSEYHKDSHTLIEMIEEGNSLKRNHKTLSKLG